MVQPPDIENARAVPAPPAGGAWAKPPVLNATSRQQVGVMVTATILVGFALWALRGLLTPFALAIFLLLMIDGLARGIVRRAPWMPEALALPAAIAFIVAVFGLAIWAIVINASHFAAESHGYAARLDAILLQLSNRMGVYVPSSLNDLLDEVNPSHYLGMAATGLRKVGEGAVFVLIYLGFLIASRQGFAAKAAALFPQAGELREAARVFNHIRVGVESYVWVQTVVGFIIAAISAGVMMAMGLSHALFWAFLIFLANYIPAIGAAVGVLLPPLFALVEFNAVWRAVLLLALLEAVHFAVSHVLQPRMQGKNLNVDPIVVLLSLTFWGLIWGVTGAFLSTPLTVMIMAVLAEFDSTRWIAVLLSSDGKPYADVAGAAGEADAGLAEAATRAVT